MYEALCLAFGIQLVRNTSGVPPPVEAVIEWERESKFRARKEQQVAASVFDLSLAWWESGYRLPGREV